MSDLSFLAQSIQELDRLKQLNYELLEELEVLLDYMYTNKFPIPDREKFSALLTKTHSLLTEIHRSPPLTLQYHKLSDGSYHGEENDGKLPVPTGEILIKSTERIHHATS